MDALLAAMLIPLFAAAGAVVRRGVGATNAEAVAKSATNEATVAFMVYSRFVSRVPRDAAEGLIYGLQTVQ